MIRIEFNGHSKEVEESTTLADLLKASGVESRYCAVELNEEIVPKTRYLEQRLNEGDRIEVVTLVGGG